MFHHAGAETVSGTFAAEFADTRLDLSTKVGIVTGGGRGIGSATCVSLAKAGIKAVGVVDLLDDLDGIAKEINAKIQPFDDGTVLLSFEFVETPIIQDVQAVGNVAITFDTGMWLVVAGAVALMVAGLLATHRPSSA